MVEKRRSPAANGARKGFNIQSLSPSDLLLTRLERVKETGPGRWVACCPAHGDRSPSLSVRETEDGAVLIHCFAGCPSAAVILAMGLAWSDLYPANIKDHAPIRPGQRWVPRDVLLAVSREALVALIAAETVAKGEPLGAEDRKRLRKAALVLRNAAREVGHAC